VATVSGLADINELIAQLMRVERARGPLALYQNDRQALTLRSASLTDLRSNLSALNTQVQSLMQPGTLSPFQAKTVTSSNAAVATATATTSALAGTHSLLVTQLAKPDTLTTKKFTDTGTDIITAEGAGTKTIRISVDSTNYDINVTLAAGETNKTILTNMAAAINGHATASTKVSASVVQIDSTSSKLVLTSKQTGLTHALSLSDQTGTLFATTDLRDSAAADDATNRGGYLYADSALDAKFTLDGLSLTRSGNTVTDALTGVTLSLLAEQAGGATPVTLTVGADQAGIKAKVQSFLDSYNTAIKFLRERTGTTVTSTTSATGAAEVTSVNRGTLDAEPAYLNLMMNLRSDVGGRITTPASGGPASLSEIGITAASDGTLSISDTTKFTDALNANAGNVATLFNSSDGIATRVSSRLAGFVQTGGIVDGSLSVVTSRLSSLSSLIKAQEDSLKIKEDALRRQLIGLQKVLAQLQLQEAALGSA
jgi:flagellar hook-associated protein 2